MGNNDYVVFFIGYLKFENIGGLVKKFIFCILWFNDIVFIDFSVNVGFYIFVVINLMNKFGGGGYNVG